MLIKNSINKKLITIFIIFCLFHLDRNKMEEIIYKWDAPKAPLKSDDETSKDKFYT